MPENDIKKRGLENTQTNISRAISICKKVPIVLMMKNEGKKLFPFEKKTELIAAKLKFAKIFFCCFNWQMQEKRSWKFISKTKMIWYLNQSGLKWMYIT